MMRVRYLFLLFSISVAWAQIRPGDFTIRAEPTAKVQSQTPVPFEITVHDSLGKPVRQADVTLQIEHPDHTATQTYKAPSVGDGTFMAKPVFSDPGQWTVYIEVRHDNQMSARTFTYSVPD